MKFDFRQKVLYFRKNNSLWKVFNQAVYICSKSTKETQGQEVVYKLCYKQHFYKQHQAEIDKKWSKW